MVFYAFDRRLAIRGPAVTPHPNPEANIPIFAAGEMSAQKTTDAETAMIRNRIAIPSSAVFDFMKSSFNKIT
jgi:uncharacterized lipoprotein YbaY